MKVFADKLGYEHRKFMNFKKLWFPWKPVDVQLGTISENARIGDCYPCAKFYTCIKVHNLSEISSYAAGLSGITVIMAMAVQVAFSFFCDIHFRCQV